MDEQQSIYTVSTEIWPSVWQSQPSQWKQPFWRRAKRALNNSQSHRISHSQSQVHNSQALSARFIIFWLRYHGNTVLNTTVPAVVPQSLSPLPVPRYYRSSCFHYRGITVVPITMQVSTSDRKSSGSSGPTSPVVPSTRQPSTGNSKDSCKVFVVVIS